MTDIIYYVFSLLVVIATVVAPFNATSPEELSLAVGQLVLVAKQDGDWWEGTLQVSDFLPPTCTISITRSCVFFPHYTCLVNCYIILVLACRHVTWYRIFPVISRPFTTQNVERNKGGRLATRNLRSKRVRAAISFTLTGQDCHEMRISTQLLVVDI